jgi:hypothetical protein
LAAVRFAGPSLFLRKLPHEGTMSETLNLEPEIRADIERYKRMLEMYRSRKARTGALVSGEFTENTKETERHLDNVIKELEALLRDREA